MESQAKIAGHSSLPQAGDFWGSRPFIPRPPLEGRFVGQPAGVGRGQGDIRRAGVLPLPRGLGGRWASSGLTGFLMVALAFTAPAAEEPTATPPTELGIREHSRSRTEAAYHAARKAAAATNSMENLWHVGRTAFDWADNNSREKIKAQVAETGIEACRAAIAKNPTSAPAHYYLALCLGQLAQTKTITALRLVREMEKEFDRVQVLDEAFDHAGADRGLGLLYLEAPGWPTSIGDRKKARIHLERAVALAPEYPDNHLSLLDLLIQVKDHRAAAMELAAMDSIWVEAKRKFSGKDWAAAWLDWDARRTLLEAKLRKPAGKTSASSPR